MDASNNDSMVYLTGDESGSTATFGFPAQPHLGVIALGLNDCRIGYSPDSYQRVIRRMVQAFRRGQSDGSIATIAFSNPDGESSDTVGFPNAKQWGNFIADMKSIAQTYNSAFVNINAKWGELGTTYGYQTANQPHPTDAGHADIAALLEAIFV